MPENPYGFAVMYTDGEDMGEYLGYFQDSMDTAESVADEIMSNSDQLSPIGIYRLVLVKTIEPPAADEDEDDDGE